MCYVVLVSTSSSKDLTIHNNELVRFSRDLPEIVACKYLKYPHKWYVGSKAGCSCVFRHLYSVDLGFGEPVDWYPEDPDEIAATIQLIEVIRGLLVGGEAVDCIDAWHHSEMDPVSAKALEVDLAKVSNGEFRFFENYHFVFTYTA